MANKVGPLIKEARTGAGFTQEQLAKKLKTVTAAEISKAERGELELTQTTLKEIAKLTGVTQTSLIEAAKKSTYGAAAKSTTPAKRTSANASTTKSTAKSPTGKTTGKAATKSTKAKDTDPVKLTAAEKTMLAAYRKANAATKKTALHILQGEKLTVSELLPYVMDGITTGADGLAGLGSLLGKFKG